MVENLIQIFMFSLAQLDGFPVRLHEQCSSLPLVTDSIQPVPLRLVPDFEFGNFVCSSKMK